MKTIKSVRVNRSVLSSLLQLEGVTVDWRIALRSRQPRQRTFFSGGGIASRIGQAVKVLRDSDYFVNQKLEGIA
jgi:hypothetical protein